MRLASRFITADIKLAQRWTLYSALVGILVGIISLFFHTALTLTTKTTDILASLLTVGSGGSAGREGPVSLIGAGVASWLARRIHLNNNDTRLLLMCGTAAGIGSIFRTPLGGAIFAIEVLYRRDMETDGLVQAFISSTVAYSVFAYFSGWQPVFTTPQLVFNQPHELILYALLGAVCVPVASLFTHILQSTHNLFHWLQLPVFQATR